MEKVLRRNQTRRVPRVEVDFPVTATINGKKSKFQACQLSEFGVLISPARRELIGEDADLELHLEDTGAPMTVSGVIFYGVAEGIGVRFEDISEDRRAVLKSYVQLRGIGVVKPF